MHSVCVPNEQMSTGSHSTLRGCSAWPDGGTIAEQQACAGSAEDVHDQVHLVTAELGEAGRLVVHARDQRRGHRRPLSVDMNKEGPDLEPVKYRCEVRRLQRDLLTDAGKRARVDIPGAGDHLSDLEPRRRSRLHGSAVRCQQDEHEHRAEAGQEHSGLAS